MVHPAPICRGDLRWPVFVRAMSEIRLREYNLGIGRGMTHWVRGLSPPLRVLVYAALAILAFALAAGAGAMGALTLREDVGLPERQGPRSADEQRVERPAPTAAADEAGSS